MATEGFDPWTLVRTVHDLPADEVISTLQKEIRRGNAENAALCAYEMVYTSPEMERKLWDRLCIISVEDIGFGEPLAPLLIQSLWEMSQRFGRHEGDRYTFAIHAVRYLASRAKDRSSDEMHNWLLRAVEEQGLRPTIPDYALDMHTARGMAMGRDLQYFLEVGAQIDPELPGRDKTYRERLLKIVRS
ncbi:MAG: AAA family ATPase [Chloroflexi bacterium]|nr:AAA family ATPase [Chloroflexota bacterium]